MFIIGNFLLTVAHILRIAIYVYIWAIIIRSLLSWFRPNPYQPAVRFLYRFTDPVLDRVRQFLPNLGGLDISPIIVIFGLYFLDNILVNTLIGLAYKLQ